VIAYRIAAPCLPPLGQGHPAPYLGRRMSKARFDLAGATKLALALDTEIGAVYNDEPMRRRSPRCAFLSMCGPKFLLHEEFAGSARALPFPTTRSRAPKKIRAEMAKEGRGVHACCGADLPAQTRQLTFLKKKGLYKGAFYCGRALRRVVCLPAEEIETFVALNPCPFRNNGTTSSRVRVVGKGPAVVCCCFGDTVPCGRRSRPKWWPITLA